MPFIQYENDMTRWGTSKTIKSFAACSYNCIENERSNFFDNSGFTKSLDDEKVWVRRRIVDKLQNIWLLQEKRRGWNESKKNGFVK